MSHGRLRRAGMSGGWPVADGPGGRLEPGHTQGSDWPATDAPPGRRLAGDGTVRRPATGPRRTLRLAGDGFRARPKASQGAPGTAGFLDRDLAVRGDGVGQTRRARSGWRAGRHHPPVGHRGRLDRREPEAGREHAVERGRRTAALDVAEDGGSVSKPVRYSISWSSRTPIPPSRGWPNSSRCSSATAIVPALGVAPSAATTIEK